MESNQEPDLDILNKLLDDFINLGIDDFSNEVNTKEFKKRKKICIIFTEKIKTRISRIYEKNTVENQHMILKNIIFNLKGDSEIRGYMMKFR